MSLKGAPYRKATFETYYAWKTLPDILRGQSNGILVRAGISDAGALELASILTQQDFAKRFGVTERTLSRWNVRVDALGPIPEIRRQMSNLTKNVLWALYQSILHDAKAPEFRAWMEVMEGKGSERKAAPKSESSFNLRDSPNVAAREAIKTIAATFSRP